ncbi:MAG: phosphate regulon sensor histidine kinase PhoR [Gammaproteobacteria bacterium]|nr:phosphate regulon sensor histidine kinase PhoR [Gammaproteobacteria bacterium]
MQESRVRELFRLAGLLLAGLVLGAMYGSALAGLLLALLLYLGWMLFWLFRLEHWLIHDRRAMPPEAAGIWGDVFYQLYRHFRKNRRRKQRIARLIRAFRDSTSAMPDGAVLLNRSWQILWLNDAAARLLGLDPGQDVGQRVANLLRNPLFVRYLVEGDFSRSLELPSPLDDEQQLSLQISAYGDGQRLMLIRDITRLHRLEQVRQQFVANASHELRTPLTVMRGYIEAMQDEPSLQDEWQQPLQEMSRQAERMAQIVEGLLHLSRLETAGEAMENERVAVGELLESLVAQARLLPGAPQDISLELQSDASLRGSRDELFSAFSNLLFNAARYTPEDGKVTVRWSVDAGRGRVDVSDTGIGIAREHLPRLTERFYRVDEGRDRDRGGTGLGLAIVKHVLQRHGAELDIGSTPGKGSRFSCLFPASRVLD